jgi:hypothetical protein
MAFLILGRGPVVSSLIARLDALDSPSRLAVAAACVERVIPIFEVMTRGEVAEAPSAAHALRGAIALVRHSAQEGIATAEALRLVRSRVEDTTPSDREDYHVGSTTRMAWSVAGAVQRLLDALGSRPDELGSYYGARCSRSAEGCALAIRDSWEAVARFEDYEDRGEDEEWGDDEEKWQEEALRAAEQGQRTFGDEQKAQWFAWLEDEWGWEPGT